MGDPLGLVLVDGRGGAVGVPAFLVLSGPLPLLPRPRPGAWVLTGGWAFLLTVLLLRPLFGT